VKLRGLNPQNAELITNVNQEVYDTAAALMGAQGMVVFEEALIRSGQRKNRHLVQWKEIRSDLEKRFGRTLIKLTRIFLRERIKEQKLLQGRPFVLKEAENHLLSKGRGNEIAGYCFTTKYEELTELEIRHRRSVAAGFQRSADVIAHDRDHRLPEPENPTELPLAASGEEGLDPGLRSGQGLEPDGSG